MHDHSHQVEVSILAWVHLGSSRIACRAFGMQCQMGHGRYGG